MKIFQQMESEVRSYSRAFPVVFHHARGSYLFDDQGKAYLDFLSGAGSLNYGHNNPLLKKALLDYIEQDGIAHGLDMHTQAKSQFLTSLRDIILAPRGLEYRVQFTGPTGANAVEAALKIARKVKGRSGVIAFTNGFHGVSLGAVAATGNQHHRGGAGVPLNNIERMPFCGYHGRDADTLKMMDKLLSDPSSGVDIPAAVIIEVVQGEGGLNVAADTWLQGLQKLCRKHDMLLIVDDIQAGCGRTGSFFSFESSGIKPDIVTLSKSLSGFGLPLSIVLLNPALDRWLPGEHNGTFRGNNHAFITATAALETYWRDQHFAQEIAQKSLIVQQQLKAMLDAFQPLTLRVKGRGLMQGIECASGAIADSICRHAFERGLVIETAGNQGQVVKVFCPLTIGEEDLRKGLKILELSFAAAMSEYVARKTA
ncbi:diaminobutyrate--2-oxoglutarate transaminase [Cellvibrio sp. QJXJ]|uniref:diaminobutyrate--2-oxoglutarate transaminase n=1 Tax=Cellvibrio sp. QJXJ TaxID=2964606 RepID=UPI0021C31525|nr:diaminobutyrate--2-oxoglutarate transaminase [Cellvibrio sp. QJXJ]UUA71095.1 diaminobutyrate--2-oxoglutarate transaminase [Cellvibrio sp. QJXJ]